MSTNAITYPVAVARLAKRLGEAKFHAYMGGSNDCRFHDLDAYAISISIIYSADADATEVLLEQAATAVYEQALRDQRKRFEESK